MDNRDSEWKPQYYVGTEKARDAYTDALIRLALCQMAEEEADLEEAELLSLQACPEFAPDKQLYARIFTKMENHHKREQFKNVLKNGYRITSKVAVFLLVLTIGFMVSVVSIRAFREQVIDWLVQVQEKSTEIALTIPSTHKNIPRLDISAMKNYSVEIISEHPSAIVYELISEESIPIYLTIERIPSATTLDTENATVTTVSMMGCDTGMLIEKGKTAALFWTGTDYSVYLFAELPVGSLMELSEEIIFMKK